MCRLLLAFGKVDIPLVLYSAARMADGATAQHDGPIVQHPNGWGAAWMHPKSKEWVIHREPQSILESLDLMQPISYDINFLAVHTRHATLIQNQGMPFTHPLQRFGGIDSWYLMHNGFLPSIAEECFKKPSVFDSREYLEFLVPSKTERLDTTAVLQRLNQVNHSRGTSGNSFIFNKNYFYIIHWSTPMKPYPKYFKLQYANSDGATYVSSEIIPDLVAVKEWKEIPLSTITEINLNDPQLFRSREYKGKSK